MSDRGRVRPDSTAVRVALWRALHVQVDPAPHVLTDELGLELAAPEDGWRHRRDMDAVATIRPRSSIVARGRFIEDLVVEQASLGVDQYIILGAGLDTFAQRRPEIAAGMQIFEVDQPGPQRWKRQRLIDAGFGIPDWLRFVPVDFGAGSSWWDELVAAGLDPARPAVVASSGVTMYLTEDANAATMRQVATLAPGSTMVTTFLLPLELIDPQERPLRQQTENFARHSGTPFLSLFTPAAMLALAHESGFADARHVSAADLTERYFAGRTDGLRPSSSEELVVATTSSARSAAELAVEPLDGADVERVVPQ